MDCIPVPPIASEMAEMEARAIPGVLLQYVVNPGGFCKGDYLVVSMKELRELDRRDPSWHKSVRIQQVKGIIRDQSLEPIFPFKAAHEQAMQSPEEPQGDVLGNVIDPENG